MADTFEPLLTAGERAFLVRVRDGMSLPVADRIQDKIRQRCRRLNYVFFANNGWIITDAGRAAVTRYEAEMGI